MDITAAGVMALLRPLIKLVIDALKWVFFFKVYETSTLHHNHREAFWTDPDKLTDGLEYKLLWKPYHLSKKLVTPMIWVKATEGNTFSKVVLTSTAFNSKIKYQDNLTLYGLGCTPVQAALPSIPFRKLKIEGNTVYTPYDTIKTEVRELYDASGKQVEIGYYREHYVRPCDRLGVEAGKQKGDVEIWGEIYNLEFMEMALMDEQRRLIGSRYGSIRLISYIREKVFGLNWVVKIIFWGKNLVFAIPLRSEFIKYLDEYEKYKQWEEESNPPDSV